MNINKETIKEKLKDDFRVRLGLLLVLGFLLGVAVKTESMSRLVIGFDDYKIKAYQHKGYNFEEIKEQMKMKRAAMEEQAQNQNSNQNNGQ